MFLNFRTNKFFNFLIYALFFLSCLIYDTGYEFTYEPFYILVITGFVTLFLNNLRIMLLIGRGNYSSDFIVVASVGLSMLISGVSMLIMPRTTAENFGIGFVYYIVFIWAVLLNYGAVTMNGDSHSKDIIVKRKRRSVYSHRKEKDEEIAEQA